MTQVSRLLGGGTHLSTVPREEDIGMCQVRVSSEAGGKTGGIILVFVPPATYNFWLPHSHAGESPVSARLPGGSPQLPRDLPGGVPSLPLAFLGRPQ